jgi:hypothetical protein
VAPLALVKHVVTFHFQALISFDRLQARITSTKNRLFVQAVIETDEERIRVCSQLANFDDNEGHVVGEGTVAPGSHAVENCLLHIREW